VKPEIFSATVNQSPTAICKIPIRSDTLPLSIAMPDSSLSPDRLEVWHASCADIPHDLFSHAEQYILSGEERERMHRFRQLPDQQLYLTARLLLRSMLAAFSEVPAAEWRFRFNEHGKPETAEGFPQIHFNLSHSGGLALCAMHADREVGVDVEPLARRIGPDTAAAVLSEDEWKVYSQTEEGNKPATFLRYWVLKEAFLKATGKGLSLPLSDFSFHFDHRDTARLTSAHADANACEDWHFFEFQPRPSFAAAAAIRREGSAPVELRVKAFTGE